MGSGLGNVYYQPADVYVNEICESMRAAYTRNTQLECVEAAHAQRSGRCVALICVII